MYTFENKLVRKNVPYTPMSAEDRKKLLPERNVCSILPADTGREVFMTGNGIQRADMTGDPYKESMTFTHEYLFEPKWDRTPEPPDLTGVMPEVRRLLREGQFEAAADLVEQEQLKAGFGSSMRHVGTIDCGDIVDPPMSLFPHFAYRLNIKQPKAGETKDYLRWLNMMNGVLTTQWVNDEGAFSRELFVSFKDDIGVVRFNAPAGKLNVSIAFEAPGDDGRAPFGVKMLQGSTHENKLTEELYELRWAYRPEFGQKGYASAVKIVRKGGTAAVNGSEISITGADSVVLYGRTCKYEGGFTFELPDEFVASVAAINACPDEMIASNLAILGEKMSRSQLRMASSDDYYLSAEELLRRTHSDYEFDPVLLDKLYDMGRFYQITDTGELPPLHGQHNINTNLQVCAGNNTGLFDEMEAYFRYYETKFDDFRINAKKLFGARGLLCSIHCDYDSGLFYHFSKTYPHYCWTGCLGWVYNEFWNYWLVSGDKEFLRERIVPAYKEMALFFEDYACDRGPDGKVIFYPSFSPENPTPNRAIKGVYSTSINSVMDIMICREILDNLMEACNILGIEQENIAHWQEQKDSLPMYLLDDEGGLKEWAWPTVNENYDHRHVSHHYDVWPGHLITLETEPDLAEAILISNRKRATQNDSAHGIIHRAFTAIRLRDMPETVQNMYHLMNHGYITRALQTCHNPYQHHMPDLQGAMPALLLEMCVFSAPGVCELLPTMPDSLAKKGGISGIWMYNFAKLEKMDWTEHGIVAEITSNRAQTLNIRNRKPGAVFTVNGKAVEAKDCGIDVEFAANETKRIEIKF